MTTLNLGNSLGYSFYPHKVTLQYFEQADAQLAPAPQEDPQLSPLVSEFMACEKSGTGWSKMLQKNAHELFMNLSDISEKYAERYTKDFNDQGFGKKSLLLEDGSVAVLTFIPFTSGP